MKATLQFQTIIGGKTANATFNIDGDESVIDVSVNEITRNQETGEVIDQMTVNANRRQGINSFSGILIGSYLLEDQITLITAIDTWLNTNSARIINLINSI